MKVFNGFIHRYVEKVVKMSPAELETKGSNFLVGLGNFTKDPNCMRDQIVAVVAAGRVCDL